METSLIKVLVVDDDPALRQLLADYLNRLLADFPLLLLGSYPEFSNPEYKVKVTFESRDRGYLEGALTEFLRRLPADALVRVT